MAHEDLLAATDFFSGASPDVLVDLARHGRERQLVRGDVLFHEGDIPTCLYLVLRGRISIGSKSFDNRESVFSLMERGDLFGDMGVVDGLPRSAQAKALEASAVFEIPEAPIREVLNANPQMLWGVARLLAGRLRAMDEALADSVFLDVTGRTAKRLLELAEGRSEFVLPVTQEELAGMVGASRERVNKAIASFIRLGWIEQHERNYRIILRDRLEIRAR
jgi:CRP/FNR family transcriptional regulator, cyclic AMP receptor protein